MLRYCYSHTIGKWRMVIKLTWLNIHKWRIDSSQRTSVIFLLLSGQLSNDVLLNDVYSGGHRSPSVINLSPCWLYCMSLKIFKPMIVTDQGADTIVGLLSDICDCDCAWWCLSFWNTIRPQWIPLSYLCFFQWLYTRHQYLPPEWMTRIKGFLKWSSMSQ